MHVGQTILGRYLTIAIIGEGGQATVAKGRDLQTGQLVAIKQLRTAPGQPGYQQELARFLRAAQLRVGHPAVVDPITYGQEGSDWYMVMPFVEGNNLWQYVDDYGGHLDVSTAVVIAIRLAEALGAIHAKGVIHRDLKPHNILMGRDGSVHVCDLGICRNLYQGTIAAGNEPIGTPAWMSPEQILRPDVITAASDLYSLGGVFYWMLTGREPAEGNDFAVIMVSVCQGHPVPPSIVNPLVPAYVEQACMTLLAKEAKMRFATAAQFISALRAGTGVPPQPARGRCIRCAAPLLMQNRFCSRCGTAQSNVALLVHCLACGAQVDHAPCCSSCGRAFSSCDYRLQFRTGKLDGYVFRVPLGDYYVGRQQLLGRDITISRRHMRVQCDSNGTRITDAGSANKTRVAGIDASFATYLYAGCDVDIAGNRATFMAI